MTTETGISGGVAAAPDRFEKNKIQRRVVVAVLTTMLLAVAWIVGNRWMPGGVPPGIVVLGVVLGGLNSLIAMGLILIYRAIRVINFAQAALGGLASAVAILLVTGSHLPVLSSYWAAVPLGIILAIATGFVVDMFIHWRFERSPRLIVTVVTIGIAQVLGALAIVMPQLFRGNLSPISTFKTPFTFTFHVNPLTFTGDDLIAIIVVPVALIGLYWFLIKTDTGMAIRGAADSSERAQLLGIPVRNLSRITWMVAAGLSGVGSILAQPIGGISSSLGTFTLADSMLVPLAAFVLAGMESLPAAVFWSLIIGIVQQAVFYSFHTNVYSEVVLFFLIIIGLVGMPFVRRYTGRDDSVRVTDSGLGDFIAVREVTPIPDALRRQREIISGRALLLTIVVGAAVALPFFASQSLVADGIYCAVYATIAVSLVILTGWAGQISLGQVAIAGMGACVSGSLMVHVHVPFILALLLGGLAGAVLAILIGVPALRLEGTALAVVTLAFAVVMSDYVLSSQYFPWLDPDQVGPQNIFERINLDILNPNWLYELSLVVLLVGIVIAHNLRRSRSARAIVAVRDNSRAASAYGVSPLKSKLLAFGVSGFIAGIAGAVYIVSQSGISSMGFSADDSINAFIMVVIGGLGSITGGVIGALYLTVVSTAGDPTWQLLGTGAGVLVVLSIFPEGLGGLVFLGRDFVVAQVAKSKGLTGTGELVFPQSASPPRLVPPSPSGPDDGAKRLIHTAALRLGALEDLELHGGGAITANTTPDATPPDGRRSLVAVSDVDAAYGNSQILFGVGLGVAQREVVALLGTNGAGKTTVLRIMSGLMRPKKGRIEFMGEDITSLAPVLRVRAGLVTVLGGRGIFPSLTVEENLRLAAWTARRYQKDKHFATAATDRVLSFFPVLRARQHQRAGLLSGGEQQMLALGQSLLCRPKLLLIDELSLGLAPSLVTELLEVIRALAASGVTVVIVEQSVNVATAISNRAIFLERGRVRFSGPTPDISKQPELLRSVFLHAAERARKRRLDAVGSPTRKATSDAVISALLGGVVTPTPPPLPTGVAPPAQGAGRGPLVEPACAFVGVTKNYGGVSALSNISLQVAPGEILGIIGSNGAGKTTLFDVASGFVTPDEGHVTMDGVNITRLSPAQRANRGLGRVFQDARLWPSMTVHDAIATALEQFVPVRDPLASALALAQAERSEEQVQVRAEELIEEFGLGRFRDAFVSDLSTGTRRVVELSCAVANDPMVLLLDEPTSGIAQREGEALGELLLGLREQTGAAFIIIEHDVPLVSSLADRMICMHLGQIIAEGDTTDVLTDPVVVAAYLGADAIASHHPEPPRSPVGAATAEGAAPAQRPGTA
jgi:ABC-type branched-subunit amino acid transport system ATPase component/ABC-type branched-subunit amino acid transport system permease subunit